MSSLYSPVLQWIQSTFMFSVMNALYHLFKKSSQIETIPPDLGLTEATTEGWHRPDIGGIYQLQSYN